MPGDFPNSVALTALSWNMARVVRRSRAHHTWPSSDCGFGPGRPPNATLAAVSAAPNASSSRTLIRWLKESLSGLLFNVHRSATFQPASACGAVPMASAFAVSRLGPHDQNGSLIYIRIRARPWRLRSEVQTVRDRRSVSRAVNSIPGRRLAADTGDLIVLAVERAVNPHILLRSGFDHPSSGPLHETEPSYVTFDLKGEVLPRQHGALRLV